MDRSVTLSRALYAAAGGLTLLALTTYVAWRPPASGAASDIARAAIPGPPPAPATSSASVPDSVAIGQIVSTNIFSQERRPPRRRFTPTTAVAVQVPNADTAPAGPPPIRLYGVTLNAAGGGVALIEADPRIPGAEIYRIGDAVRGALLTALSESTAVLEREDGSTSVLRLAPRRERRP
jgi:hypothetical protein